MGINKGGIVMSEFQFALLQLALLGINLSMLVASIIVSTAINKLAKTIKEKQNESNDFSFKSKRMCKTS